MSSSGVDRGEGLRAAVFASEDGAAWGAVVPDGGAWSLVIGPADGPWVAAAAGLDLAEESDGGWRLGRDGDSSEDRVELRLVPEQPPVPPAPAAEEPAGEGPTGEGPTGEGPTGEGRTGEGRTGEGPTGEGRTGEGPTALVPPGATFVPGAGPELCRLTGTLSGRSIDWSAVRMRLGPPRSARDEPSSARFVAGWLADGSAFGLIAARSRRAERADQDVVSATLFDPDLWLAVSEPRLSTTYGAGEVPSRVNLELWVGEGEHEFPRRAAGEASGAAVAVDGARGEGSVRVIPLRCHSRGEDGFGIYVLTSL